VSSAYSRGGDHSDHGAGGDAADPTSTTALRRRYAERLRGRWSDVNTEIRAGVAERDELGFEPRRVEALSSDDVEPVPAFEFETNQRKRRAFEAWFREQVESHVLNFAPKFGNEFIRSAYGSGLRYAESRLREAGVSVATPGGEAGNITPSFDVPIHKKSLERLYTRAYENLQGITDDTAVAISETLTESFADGVNPREAADRLTDRVNSIGKARSTVLARTEVINAHSTATLDRYERQGVDGVTTRTEWSATNDSRTCPICERLDGEVRSVEETRSETFEFDGREYNVKPPCHAQCRCALLPVIN
jgi:SPP1 gp7 family putative phage head morphogenesis protein